MMTGRGGESLFAFRRRRLPRVDLCGDGRARLWQYRGYGDAGHGQSLRGFTRKPF